MCGPFVLAGLAAEALLRRAGGAAATRLAVALPLARRAALIVAPRAARLVERRIATRRAEALFAVMALLPLVALVRTTRRERLAARPTEAATVEKSYGDVDAAFQDAHTILALDLGQRVP